MEQITTTRVATNQDAWHVRQNGHVIGRVYTLDGNAPRVVWLASRNGEPIQDHSLVAGQRGRYTFDRKTDAIAAVVATANDDIATHACGACGQLITDANGLEIDGSPHDCPIDDTADTAPSEAGNDRMWA